MFVLTKAQQILKTFVQKKRKKCKACSERQQREKLQKISISNAKQDKSGEVTRQRVENPL